MGHSLSHIFTAAINLLIRTNFDYIAGDMPIREPAASRRTLITTAAYIWAAVGIFLIFRAILYYPAAHTENAMLTFVIAALGIVLGLLKGYFVFARLAKRNVARIRLLSPHKEKICVFAFQAWESYLVVLIMVTAGILLRLSPLPRTYLLGIYLLIGIGLLVGSGSYLKARD